MSQTPSLPKLLGIGGGIGSGKSTVCKILEIIGVQVYYSDTRARFLMENNAQLIEDLSSLFGANAYADGTLNSKYISSLVFKNPALLTQLNELVHPVVKKDSLEWTLSHADQLYVAKESALLFETGIYKDMQYSILVTSPLYLRIERIKKRDNLSEEQILERMSRQWGDEEKRKLSNEVIFNDEVNSIIEQTWHINQKLKKLWTIQES